MKILFIHQNFPAQFKFLAPALIRRGHDIACLTFSPDSKIKVEGVNYFGVPIRRSSTRDIHPWLADFETKTIRGEAYFRAAYKLKKEGYQPDLIIAHPGWGESMFLKEVWPTSIFALYCEFFYRSKGLDVGFDPEFPVEDIADSCRLMLKNINNNFHLKIADVGISPTRWQASTFPKDFQNKITVIHDGINTKLLKPNPSIDIVLDSGLKLTKQNEVVTFINRNLEPYRGYHIFMRSLPYLLKKRPNALILIIGGDKSGYGKNPPDGKTWKQIFASEINSQLNQNDIKRIKFLGNLPYEKYVAILQLSRVHVYLTYPFVLSWSLLESMSIGCSVIASKTDPLKEVIEHNRTGVYVDFFDHEALSIQISNLLDNDNLRHQLSLNARDHIINNYDLESICLPSQIEWVENLLKKK